MKLKNVGKSSRTYSAKGEGDRVISVTLEPGSEIEADFIETKGLRSAIDEGYLVKSAAAKPAAEKK